MTTKEDNSLDLQPSSYTLSYLEATQTNEKEVHENLHTKAQCQKQQLQHILLERNRKHLLEGRKTVK